MTPPVSQFRPPNPFNMAEYFLDGRVDEGLGEEVALRGEGAAGLELTTYARLQARANQFANVLQNGGIEPQQRVLIALPDVPDFAAALFGTVKTGAVAVMVNCFLPARRLAEIIAYTGASVVVTDHRRRDEFERACASFRRRDAGGGEPRAPSLLVLGTGDGSLPGNDRCPLAGAATEFESFPSRPDDPAIWLFSGGTTGTPKAVVQTHASFANTTELYARGVLGYSSADVTLSVPKLHFGYATGSNLLFPLSVGGSAVLFPQRCTPQEVFRQIAMHRPTILVNVPTMVNGMVSSPDAANQDLSCLRLATSAGEPLPPSVHRCWNDLFGVELLDGLGTAEMWHVFISNRPGDVRPGSLGRAVPGFDVRLCDEEGLEVAPGAVGRMRVRGKSLARGYWQRPEASREAFQGEWYLSGDMMTRDNQGWFTYQGRADDLIKVSGKWFLPAEVEEVILAHPLVEEVAVVAVEGKAGLAIPVAFVVPRAGEPRGPDGDRGALEAHCRASLESYKVPRAFLVLDDLPRTHLGKVDRGSLKQMWADRGE